VSSPARAPGEVLAALGIDASAWLGSGGEANVYALDANRIARVHRGAPPENIANRISLLAELAHSASAVPFRIPDVLDRIEIHDCIVTVETKLPGRSLAEVLRDASGSRRSRLIHSYLEAASCIGDLALERSWYGDLAGRELVRAETFRTYVSRRAGANLAAAGEAFAGVDAAGLAAALPEPERPWLVHHDAFPANMMVEGDRVSAVIDFGTISIMGDRRMDPVTAAIYLEPTFSPTAAEGDRRVAAAWLAENDLAELHEPLRRWLAAYWAPAHSIPRLVEWSRRVLVEGDGAGGKIES